MTFRLAYMDRRDGLGWKWRIMLYHGRSLFVSDMGYTTRAAAHKAAVRTGAKEDQC